MQKQKYSNLSIFEQQQRQHENAVKCASYFVGRLHWKTNKIVFDRAELPFMNLGQLEAIIQFCTVTLGIKQFNK